MTNANPETKKWQTKIEAAILRECEWEGLKELIDYPVTVDCVFYLPKPKTVKRPHPCHSYDLDKLQRVIGDALEGTLLKNDARICKWFSEKRYSDQPRVMVSVGPML